MVYIVKVAHSMQALTPACATTAYTSVRKISSEEFPLSLVHIINTQQFMTDHGLIPEEFLGLTPS